jgi:hypothetical protein
MPLEVRYGRYQKRSPTEAALIEKALTEFLDDLLQAVLVLRDDPQGFL